MPRLRHTSDRQQTQDEGRHGLDASGLRLGTVQAKNVDTGDGSINAVVNAVNGANVGVTAAAIQSSPGQYKLQLASSGTGLAGAVSTATGGISLGTFNSIGTAQDAKVTVGTGPGAFTVTSKVRTPSTVTMEEETSCE